MRCLNRAECEQWLGRSSISISSNRDLLIPESSAGKRAGFSAPIPTTGFHLAHFAADLAHWMPTKGERLLWLKNWETTPKFELQFFESITKSGGHLIEFPGILFDADEVATLPNGSDRGAETSLIAGYFLLVMCYEWDAYLVSDQSADFVYTSDTYVLLSTSDKERRDKAFQLLRGYKLDVKQVS